ncbi:MAG: hypothetical protein MUF24_13250 [Chitinophagaceae bacterium]|nr:hypothetical protein [Chitinophagaceae bacterium]
MQQVILAYLYQEGQLYLPELGLWTIASQGAQYDDASQTLQPPGYKISWQPPHIAEAMAIQPLLGYISRQTGEPEENCYDMLQQWINQLELQLQEKGAVTMHGMGKLVSLNHNDRTFIPEQSPITLLKAIHAPRLTAEQRIGSLPVGNKPLNTPATQPEHPTPQEPEEATNAPEVPLQRDKWWWVAPLIAGATALGFIVAKLLGYL